MQENIMKIKSSLEAHCSTQLIANLAMVLTVLFWGVSFVSIKIAVSEIPPTSMALLRFALAASILAIVQWRAEPFKKPAKEDMPKFIAGGILGITLYFYFENAGVKLTTASNAALIVMVVPILAIILDMFFFHSKMSVLKLAGIVIAVIGSYLSVTGNGQLELGGENFKGNMLILGSMLSWALYTLVNKSLHHKYSGLFLTTWQTLIGTLFLVPLSLLEYRDWQPFSLLAFWHVLFLAVCCSVIAYVLYVYALKYLDVAVTTLYLNLVPVVGVVCGYFILGERVLPVQLLGGVITVLAIVLVNKSNETASS